jgi:UMF1 family MFS transporter
MTAPSTETVAPQEPEYADKRERVGWYFYDWANSAFSTTVVTVFLGPYLIHIAENAAGGENGRVHPFGLSIRPGSVFSYAVSISVILQVIVLPIAGAIADRTHRKRELLALFAYIGAAATIAMVFLTGDRYLLGVGLLIVANLAFGASVVVYNSFLPQLAAPDDRDKVSSVGWAIGYIGGGLLLALNFVAATVWSDNTEEVARWSIVSAGVWWAAFTTLPLRRLKNRPASSGEHRGSVLTDGFRQLGKTLAHLRSYPLTLLFLIAFLIYNDGIQTVITQATVYADKYLKLTQGTQLETILLVQFLAFGGALLLGRMAKRYGAKKTVLFSLLLWTVVLAIAYVLPVDTNPDADADNLNPVLAFIGLGALLGIVLGGSQALSRSLFSQLIPKGKEGEYYGLYEISDKGTSWMGPLVFGLAYDIYGNYQYAIVSLLIFFVVGFLMLLAVPMRRAIVAAGNTPPHIL